MSVSHTTSSIQYNGNGSASTPYVIPFYFLKDAHISYSVDGVAVASGFTLTGEGNEAGGTLVTNVIYTVDQVITIWRTVPMTQEYGYSSGGSIGEGTLERNIDTTLMQIQQVDKEASRSLKIDDGTGMDSTTVAVLPDTVLGFDSLGIPKALTASEQIDQLNLPETVVDRPNKVWADDAARAVAVPDYVGQDGHQIDTSSDYYSTGLSAGNWTIKDYASDAVRTTAQTLTSTQQTQARTNIGAGTTAMSMEDSAGVVPFRLPANVSPFTDPDADAVITATSTTDERGINHYQRIVQLFKGLGLWSTLQDAYLIGDKWQDNSASLKSITGNNLATGTCTLGSYSGTFDGSANGHTFANDNQTTGVTGQTFFAVFKNTAKSVGSLQTSALVSNYQGGSTQGMGLSAGQFAGNGSSALDDVGCIGSETGSSNVKAFVSAANDYKDSVAIATLKDGSLNVFGNSFNPARVALPTLHNNNATYGLGKAANGVYYFQGEIMFAGVLDIGLTDYEAFALRLGIESILGDVLDLPGSIVFEGNSLTGQASGGGSPYPSHLMLKSGWSDIKRWSNVADGGAEQIQKVEAQYFTEVRQWLAIAGQKSMFILWSGINDVSNISGLTSATLTASLKRSIQRAKAEGFWVGLIPLTPVADAADGLTYGYDATQQALLADTNTWMETEGANLVDQFIDIRLIGDTLPLFLDPTDSTYYTSGDGLHHNDAGRQAIADYIDSVVTPPTL